MPQSDKDLRITLCLLLVIVTAGVYGQVATHDFLNYDDQLFVYGNSHVFTGLNNNNLKWAFTTLNGNASYWHPLTWLSLQMDCQLFGLRPGPLHLTNLWLHLANSVLLIILLNELTGALVRSFVVSALFALHPLHIESVAWISERKTLLCTLFWFLASLAYVRYVRRPNLSRYIVVFLLVAASLASKPFAVTLPFTFLLLDYWPLNRLKISKLTVADKPLDHLTKASMRRLVGLKTLFVEKIPLFVIAGAASWLTIAAQLELHAVATLKSVPLHSRIENALISYTSYIRKMFWPFDLAPIYPLRIDVSWWQVVGCILFISCITHLTVRMVSTRPYLFVGWLWYLGTLIPVIGLVQAGAQGMADRYTYVPLIGIFWMLTWCVCDCAKYVPATKLLAQYGTGIIIVMSALSTEVQLNYWKNSIRLFRHAVQSTDENGRAYQNLGIAYQIRGNIVESEASLRKSIRATPGLGSAHSALAVILAMEGNQIDALTEFNIAVKLSPQDPDAHAKLADFYANAALSRLRDPAKAVLEARKACQLTHNNQRKFLVLLAGFAILNKQFDVATDAAIKVQNLSVSISERKEAKLLLDSLSGAQAKRSGA